MKKLEVGARVHVVASPNNSNWIIKGQIVEIESGRIVVKGYQYHWTKRPNPLPEDWPKDWPKITVTYGWGPWEYEVEEPDFFGWYKEPDEITIAVPGNVYIFILS